MRYNNRYLVQSSNLNNSLVFYHTLFNRMPDEMNGVSLNFKLEDFTLVVTEDQNEPLKNEPLIFSIEDEATLAEVNDRMNRFRPIARMNNNCEVLEAAIGLMDPDGNKWIIGDPNREVHFEKCYFKS